MTINNSEEVYKEYKITFTITSDGNKEIEGVRGRIEEKGDPLERREFYMKALIHILRNEKPIRYVQITDSERLDCSTIYKEEVK